MKILKVLSILGLIILIGFIACKDYPTKPETPDPDPVPSIIEVTVVYTNNGPVTAVTPIWQITLISTDIKEELRDRIYTNYFYKAKGKFLIIEFTAKNLSSLPKNMKFLDFSILNKNNDIFIPDQVAFDCFDNALFMQPLYSNQEFPEPKILVFDLFDLNDLTLVFTSTTTPTIKIFFKLFNLNQSQNSN